MAPAVSAHAPSTALDNLWDDVPEAMAANSLPGLSIAVFDQSRIVETRSFGVRSAEGDTPIDADTAFSTASVAKPITAMLCMMLAAEGVIDLDAPIAQSLTSWSLPESDLPGTAEVTWRQLLSHTAGTSQHGFADFYEGDTVPTLVDSLEGRLPRYDRPIEFLFAPGTSWKYSGGGYVIVQLALEDVTGRRLADLAQERIFTPLGMTRSSMIQPGEAGFTANAALVHDENGAVIGTGLPITPQVSASGLWSTPSDLARFAMAIQRALGGESTGTLTPAIAREMTDIAVPDHVGGMGTPFFRGFGYGNTDWFQHGGSNTGVNVDMFGAMEGGYGFVIMGNGDDPATDPVFALLRREIIGGMGWAEREPLAGQPIPADLRAAITGTYTGLLYDLGLDYTIASESSGDDATMAITSPFFIQFLGRERSEIKHVGDGVFAFEDYPNRLRFDRDASGAIYAVTIWREGQDDTRITRYMDAMR